MLPTHQAGARRRGPRRVVRWGSKCFGKQVLGPRRSRRRLLFLVAWRSTSRTEAWQWRCWSKLVTSVCHQRFAGQWSWLGSDTPTHAFNKTWESWDSYCDSYCDGYCDSYCGNYCLFQMQHHAAWLKSSNLSEEHNERTDKSSSKMSVNFYQSNWCHTPQQGDLQMFSSFWSLYKTFYWTVMNSKTQAAYSNNVPVSSHDTFITVSTGQIACAIWTMVLLTAVTVLHIDSSITWHNDSPTSVKWLLFIYQKQHSMFTTPPFWLQKYSDLYAHNFAPALDYHDVSTGLLTFPGPST
jgi:hypothetical protein